MKRSQPDKITVYYDGACPTCIRDRKHYEKLSGEQGKCVEWFDITGKDDELRNLGIDPKLAVKELHIKTDNGQIISELDAYILLMQRTLWLKPLAIILNLPIIRPLLAKAYHRAVTQRLRRSGRL